MKRVQVKKGVALFCAMALLVGMLSGCQTTKEQPKKEDARLTVVTTIFPYYDFVRQVAGDLVNLTMIVPAGMDTHSFEPTAADMVTIGSADLFIYNGGEMESWVPQVIQAASNQSLQTDNMMDHVETVTEEVVAGMEAEHEEDEGEEVEYDEHIWTSPRNAQKIVTQIAEDLSEADPDHQAVYEKNAKTYIAKLKTLDQEFQTVVADAPNKYLVFGDRFPLRYFVDEYGLDYTAAFAGCSSDTEPSADTVAYLTDQMKEHHLPVVLKIELTSDKVAKSIAEASGAKVETFYTCHNVTKEQLEQGVTYLDLMEKNVGVLKEALQ